MGIYLLWIGRLVAIASLFNLAHATFKLGLSIPFKNAIALYKQTIYPLMEPIIYLAKLLKLSIDKDIAVLFSLTIALLIRTYMIYKPKHDNVINLTILFYIVVFMFAILVSLSNNQFMNENINAIYFVILVIVPVIVTALSIIFFLIIEVVIKIPTIDLSSDRKWATSLLREYILLFAACLTVTGINYTLT